MAAEGRLFVHALEGHWMDVGRPSDYLGGLRLHLGALRARGGPGADALAPVGPVGGAGGADGGGAWECRGDVIVDPTAVVEEGAVLGPCVSVGRGCRVGAGARLSDCVVMSGAKVRDHARVAGSIVGWDSTVGRWACVAGASVLGADVHVREEITLLGAVVLPHKEIKEDSTEPGKIVM